MALKAFQYKRALIQNYNDSRSQLSILIYTIKAM
jgi:hypothetical protein